MKIRNGALFGWVVAVGFALIGCSEGSDAASEAGQTYDRTLGSVEAAEQAGEGAAEAAGEAEEWAEDTANAGADGARAMADSAGAAVESAADSAGEAAENAAEATDEAVDDARKAAERRGEAVTGSIDTLDAGSASPSSS